MHGGGEGGGGRGVQGLWSRLYLRGVCVMCGGGELRGGYIWGGVISYLFLILNN